MAGARKTNVSLSITVLLIALVNNSGEEQKPYVVFTNGAASVRNLPICSSPRTACNIIHKRFWLSPLVKRLCKCPDRTECSQEWSMDTDNNTVMLNGRAQMKFCGQVVNLPNCNMNEIATVIESYNTSGSGLVRTTEVSCYCPNWHYFNRLRTNISRNNEGYAVKKEYYGCQPIGACGSGEFCGHITTDLYETYYQCSCPKQHICVMNNRQTTYITEALYEGLAYRGICTSLNEHYG